MLQRATDLIAVLQRENQVLRRFSEQDTLTEQSLPSTPRQRSLSPAQAVASVESCSPAPVGTALQYAAIALPPALPGSHYVIPCLRLSRVDPDVLRRSGCALLQPLAMPLAEPGKEHGDTQPASMGMDLTPPPGAPARAASEPAGQLSLVLDAICRIEHSEAGSGDSHRPCAAQPPNHRLPAPRETTAVCTAQKTFSPLHLPRAPSPTSPDAPSRPWPRKPHTLHGTAVSSSAMRELALPVT